ncbi:MAG TPA: hypothetical protein VND98_02560 [Solirubrobacterales bacterium]|nr:hypothetical protein [Solirubrobacterales bacterium]
MRPVNLIPPEQRREANGPMRSGPLVYIVVGALIAALAGVTALVLTGNQVAERKTEIAQLQREDATVRASTRRLVAYGQFRTLREERIATVTSLANSRFDWERVMRELSRVLPEYVQLTKLNATDSPKVSSGSASSGSGSGLRASIAGPAIEMEGCTIGQRGVARFLTVLKGIDGVTRVGVETSALPKRGESGAAASSGSGGGANQCPPLEFVAQFKMVVAFDGAPVVSEESSPSTAAAPTTASGSSTTASGSSTKTSSSGSSEGGG